MAKLESAKLTIDGVEHELPIPDSIDSNDGTIDMKLVGGISGSITQLMMGILNEEAEAAREAAIHGDEEDE